MYTPLFGYSFALERTRKWMGEPVKPKFALIWFSKTGGKKSALAQVVYPQLNRGA